MRRAYAQELPSKISAIKAEWQRIQLKPTQYAINELILKIHNLRGSGATFGFPEVSAMAHKLEDALHFMHLNHTSPEETVEALFLALEKAAHTVPQMEIDHILPLTRTRQATKNTPRILLICDKPAIADDLNAQLNKHAISTEIIESSANLLPLIEKIHIDAIVIELSPSADPSVELSRLQGITRLLEHPPSLIVISERDDLYSRLNAVRAGVGAFFSKPVHVQELADFIRSRQLILSEPAFRILIVDDYAQVAHHTALILQRAKMETCVETDPMKVLELLTIFHPELILLDLNMPGCNGLELASVIRQHCIYTGTTIVFFSEETAIDRHIDALKAGGDEFFIKSMGPKRLVAAVEAKAKRSRTIKRLMLRDGLTGLLNRASFDERLQWEITKSRRLATNFSYVMLDLGHFKSINDQFGHRAGDEVLSF
ncbi:MAG: response regulator [Methylobacter sp.]|nr:response regulator [Methylobacter sp.]